IEALSKMDAPPAIVGYYQGLVLAGQGKNLEENKENNAPGAIRMLETAAGNATAAPALFRQIKFLLGQWYYEVGQLDRCREAYVRALSPDPLDEQWYPVSMKTAALLTEMGRAREAMSIYDRVALQYKNAVTPLARLKLQEMQRLPKE